MHCLWTISVPRSVCRLTTPQPDPPLRGFLLGHVGRAGPVSLAVRRHSAEDMKAIIAIAVAGLAAGIVGGFLGHDTWFYGGEAVAFVVLLILWLYSIWKRPRSIVDVDADDLDDAPPAIDPVRAEQELQRKNRGTVPTPK